MTELSILELAMTVQVFDAVVNALVVKRDLPRTKDSNANSSL
jgi:hypothetical protein